MRGARHDEVEELVSEHGLVSLGLRKRALPAAFMSPMLDVGLVLTHACNLACTYCYTGEKKRVRMSREMAMRALDVAFSPKRTALQLTFFGGEPLLEAELLLEVAAEARRRAAPATKLLLQTTTNGTLLDRDLLARLDALGVHLTLSLDGEQASHDRGRPLAGGGSSFEQVRGALALLLERNKPFDVIAVVDPCNVHALAESVQWLTNEGVTSITLNMNWSGAWTDESLATFEAQMERVAATFVAWLRRGRYVRLQPLEGVMQTSSSRTHCRAGAERVAVAPSGRVYGCPRAVGEDTGRGALGQLSEDGPWVSSSSGPPGDRTAGETPSDHCACACAEETGDALAPGPVLLHHNRVLEDIGARVNALLRAEYELVRVVESASGEKETMGR